MKYKKGDKVKYDNEIVTVLGYSKSLRSYLTQGYSKGWRKTDNTYKTYNIKVPNMTKELWWVGYESDLEPVTNRSTIGKRAYKTFLKNGGSRNSKGQFSKQFSWQKVYDEVREVSNYIDFLVEKEKIVKWDRITKIYLKVFQKHGLIKEGVEI